MSIVSKAYNHDWKTLIEEQESSGMNMKQFCSMKDIPYHSFKNHKYALQKEIQTFIPIRRKQSNLIDLVINGNTISLDSQMDDASLSRVLKALIQ